MNLATWGTRAFFAAQAVCWAVIGVVWFREWWRRDRRVIEDARKDVALPGPGRPQPSGIGPGENTRIHTWTPAQLAFIHGDTDSLPECTLPAPTDIPEENPS